MTPSEYLAYIGWARPDMGLPRRPIEAEPRISPPWESRIPYAESTRIVLNKKKPVKTTVWDRLLEDDDALSNPE